VISRRNRPAAAVLGIAALLILAPAASVSVAKEDQTGATVLTELEAGKLRCTSLKGSDFDHIGEYMMERMFDSSQSHEAMSRPMSRMMVAG